MVIVFTHDSSHRRGLHQVRESCPFVETWQAPPDVGYLETF
jgi:hypothetical protein